MRVAQEKSTLRNQNPLGGDHAACYAAFAPLTDRRTGDIVKRLAVLLAALVMALATLAGPAFAQSAPDTQGLPTVQSRGTAEEGGVAPDRTVAVPSRSTTRGASAEAPAAQVGSANPSALAQTGLEVTTGAVLAGGLLLAGAGAVVATRRRRVTA